MELNFNIGDELFYATSIGPFYAHVHGIVYPFTDYRDITNIQINHAQHKLSYIRYIIKIEFTGKYLITNENKMFKRNELHGVPPSKVENHLISKILHLYDKGWSKKSITNYLETSFKIKIAITHVGEVIFLFRNIQPKPHLS